MFEKLKSIRERYNELEQLLSDSKVMSNSSLLQKYVKERAELNPIIEKLNEYDRVVKQISDTEELIETESDEELIEIARAELEDLNKKKSSLEHDLMVMLIPKDSN